MLGISGEVSSKDSTCEGTGLSVCSSGSLAASPMVVCTCSGSADFGVVCVSSGKLGVGSATVVFEIVGSVDDTSGVSVMILSPGTTCSVVSLETAIVDASAGCIGACLVGSVEGSVEGSLWIMGVSVVSSCSATPSVCVSSMGRVSFGSSVDASGTSLGSSVGTASKVSEGFSSAAGPSVGIPADIGVVSSEGVTSLVGFSSATGSSVGFPSSAGSSVGFPSSAGSSVGLSFSIGCSVGLCSIGLSVCCSSSEGVSPSTDCSVGFCPSSEGISPLTDCSVGFCSSTEGISVGFCSSTGCSPSVDTSVGFCSSIEGISVGFCSSTGCSPSVDTSVGFCSSIAGISVGFCSSTGCSPSVDTSVGFCSSIEGISVGFCSSTGCSPSVDTSVGFCSSIGFSSFKGPSVGFPSSSGPSIVTACSVDGDGDEVNGPSVRPSSFIGCSVFCSSCTPSVDVSSLVTGASVCSRTGCSLAVSGATVFCSSSDPTVVTGASSSTTGFSVACSSGASELTLGFSLGRASSGATVPCSSCSVAGTSVELGAGVSGACSSGFSFTSSLESFTSSDEVSSDSSKLNPFVGNSCSSEVSFVGETSDDDISVLCSSGTSCGASDVDVEISIAGLGSVPFGAASVISFSSLGISPASVTEGAPSSAFSGAVEVDEVLVASVASSSSKVLAVVTSASETGDISFSSLGTSGACVGTLASVCASSGVACSVITSGFSSSLTVVTSSGVTSTFGEDSGISSGAEKLNQKPVRFMNSLNRFTVPIMHQYMEKKNSSPKCLTKADANYLVLDTTRRQPTCQLMSASNDDETDSRSEVDPRLEGASGKKLGGRTAVENPLHCLCSPRLSMDEENDSCDEETFLTGDIGVTGFFARADLIFVRKKLEKSGLFILWSGCDRFKELDELSGITRWNNGITGWSEYFCYQATSVLKYVFTAATMIANDNDKEARLANRVEEAIELRYVYADESILSELFFCVLNSGEFKVGVQFVGKIIKLAKSEHESDVDKFGEATE
ncbi:hypothetical protein WN51_01625 [Melipona quadrifasciata]|uniref:Uncharacterized protein n=1 Tax=Melipona quadrifasciata TaxID=166423 RepID=A0A0N0U4C7_9HYME|nr:hypothetical protein WN51_01625 [Melipona quadrifasciata]